MGATDNTQGVILLAAGRSQRFGSDKRQAKFGDKTLLQATLQRYLALPCDLLLVLDACPDRKILEALPDTIHTVYAAPRRDWGMGDSLALGAEFALTANWQRCLVALADMPYVDPDTLQRILAALRCHDLVVPSYRQQWGHPVGFSRGYFTGLATLRGDRGARKILQAAAPFILEVDDPGVVKDIDFPADLA